MSFEIDDLLGGLDEINLTVLSELKVEKTITEVVEEEFILVPLDYKIFSTHNNEANGQRELIDTYKCDRVKQINPIGKARQKADLLKKALSKKVFFIEQSSNRISESGKIKTVHQIIYQTK